MTTDTTTTTTLNQILGTLIGQLSNANVEMIKAMEAGDKEQEQFHLGECTATIGLIEYVKEMMKVEK